MKMKNESEKVVLKLNIQKTKIMASCPITSWQIDGKRVEAVTGFLFLGSKITVDSDCRIEIKKTLSPWKESYDRPGQCIKKQRHQFVDKGPYSQSYSFLVVMYRCESWAIKKAGHGRTDAFKLRC